MSFLTIKDSLKQILADLNAMTDSNGNPLWGYVAMWNDHLKKTMKGENYSFLFPAVFVEVKDFYYEDWGLGVSVQDLDISFHILHQELDAGDGSLDQNFDVFDYRTAVRKYFTGYNRAPTFNNFMFKKEVEDFKHNQIYHWIEVFKTRYCDVSGSPYFNGTYITLTPWTANPSVTFIQPIIPPNTSCPLISVLDVINISQTTATLEWDLNEREIDFIYQYNTTGVAPTEFTGTSTDGNPYIQLTGLTAGTLYYFWVSSVCSDTSFGGWVGTTFTTTPITYYYRQLNVDGSKFSSNNTNFTVLVSANDSSLKNISYGGNVANTSGYDIMFFSDSGMTDLLNWEIEFYDPVNGILVAWVYLPEIYSGTLTPFYMQYGNVTINTFQGGSSGSAWSASYSSIYHLGSGLVTDSSINGQNLTNYGAISSTGKIDGGASFSYSYLLSEYDKVPTAQNSRTMTCWFKLSSNTPQVLMGYGANVVGERFGFYYDGTNLMLECYNISGYFPWTYDTNWHKITAVYNGRNLARGLSIYFDGNLQSLTFNDGTPNTSNLMIVLGGAAGNPTAIPLFGQLDECRIFNIAVGSAWEQAEYSNQSNPGNIGSPGFIIFGNQIFE